MAGGDAPDGPLARPPRIISIAPNGNLGNRMIQVMVALSIGARLPDGLISRIHLPEWGVDTPELDDLPPPDAVIGSQQFDIADIVRRLRDGRLAHVRIAGYVQTYGYLLDRGFYDPLFRSPEVRPGAGEGEILISLRMHETLTALYPPYVLLPIAFYRDVVRDTGLRPVFFGQLSPCPYLDALRAAFPRAEFRHGTGVMEDFAVIRRSRNVLLSVSTFAWLAAWLSEARRIVMPLAGLFHPLGDKPDEDRPDLLPRGDPRYEFHLFPLMAAVTPDRVLAAHDAIEGTWRRAGIEAVDALSRRRLAAERPLEPHLALFDEPFYLETYPDVRAAIEAGFVSSARDHYALHGFAERRRAFEIGHDYVNAYPDAACAVGNAEFADLEHYHATRGRARGYLARPGPVPPRAQG